MRKIKLRLFENGKEDLIAKRGGIPDIKGAMQRIFTSQDGVVLLRYLLYDWSYFSLCITPEQQALRNYATKFLNEIGNVFDVEISAEIKIAEK